MTSILKVDTIQDTAGNNIINENSDTITIGASGDTITIPSGATTTLTDGVSGDFKMNSGYGSVATAYGCRAWVNFNGTGTPAIREDGNVTSITDNGTGDYTVNFTTSISDANYAAVCTAGTTGTADSGRTLVTANANATGSCRVYGKNSNTGTLEDFNVISFSVFR
jgi:uncharacterized protein (AIM24 family)